MLLLGLFAIGRTFAASAVVSTFAFPASLELLDRLLGQPVPLAPDCVGPEAKKMVDELKNGERQRHPAIDWQEEALPPLEIKVRFTMAEDKGQ